MRDFLVRLLYGKIWGACAHRLRKRRIRNGKVCRSDCPERLSVVLLSFKRPSNIDRILSSLVLCEFVTEILISSNNPAIRITEYLRTGDPRIRIIHQPELRYASVRFEVSLETTSPFILAIDDDVFLEPEQIRTLFEALVADPTVPHGVGGQIYSASQPLSSVAVTRTNQRVECLVWLFAYTRQHMHKYFDLLERLKIDNRTLRDSEDVPLSFAGDDYSRIHNVGRFPHCPSNAKKEIATCRNPGFDERRDFLILKMRELRHFEHTRLRGDNAQTS
jgi:hypothetical protein